MEAERPAKQILDKGFIGSRGRSRSDADPDNEVNFEVDENLKMGQSNST